MIVQRAYLPLELMRDPSSIAGDIGLVDIGFLIDAGGGIRQRIA